MNSLRKKTGLLALAVALLSLTLSGPLSAYYTENLILVSIDGIRDLEAFSYDFQQQQTPHPYIPFIWDTLKPQGTAFMEMYNDVCTFTSPGHATMLTGAWQMSPNHGGGPDTTYQTRAWEPTIFEYARKDLFFSQSDVWCVVGKRNCLETNWSIHPEYGEDYKANLVQAPDSTFDDDVDSCTVLDSLPNPDAETVDELLEVLSGQNPPRLVFVNLRAVDEAGHLAAQGKKDCDYDVYIEAIRRADEQVERIWAYIDSTDYAGTTTIIVTTDHGRHDLADSLDFQGPDYPDTLDFTGHGGICRGCRHVMCLVVGPDTPDSTEVSRRTLQVDIAPTIMELLGGDGGYARFTVGQVLAEAIEDYGEPDRLVQSTPACDIQDSLVVMVWSDNSTGENQIWSRSSTDYGATFSDSVRISDSPIGAIQPDVAINDSGVHVVWLDFQLGDPDDTTYDSWHLFYKRDSDFDNTWDEDSTEFFYDLGWNILEQSHHGVGWGVWEPSIGAEQGASMITVSMQPSIVGAIFSLDGGKSWTDGVQVNDDCRFPVNVNGCSLEGSAAVTWCDQPEDVEVNNWEVYNATSSNVFNDDWTVFKKLSNDSEYSIQPTIDSDAEDTVYVAWADRDGGIFNIFFRKSTNGGSIWNIPAIPGPPVTGSGGAWQPDLAFDRTTSAQAHLVWVKSTGGDGMLYYSHYSGTSWVNTGAAEIPTPDGSVNEPDFAIDDDGTTFVVYTDVTESSRIVEWDQDPSN